MTITPRPLPLVTLLLAAAVAACGGDDAAVPTPTADAGADALPTFESLTPGTINVIKPGAPTICSRGTEYAFMVVPGARDKVIIEFEGGGACWSETSCANASTLFREEVDIPRLTANLTGVAGWYDHNRPGHPMKEWTHVFVPYCTGDVHWGDNVKTYMPAGMPSFSINHKGAVNTTAVLNWVYSQFPSPSKLFVTGCSAGGYGSVLWAPQVQQHYPSAKVYHFSDSAAGIITADFFDRSFPSWNVQPHFPSFVDFASTRSLATLYKAITARYPQNVYSQFNTVLDANQVFYYQALGGKDQQEWSTLMKASIKDIQGASPSFRAFLAEGEQHCILPKDNFYEAMAGGVKLTDWLSRMVNDQPIENAYCPTCAP